MLGLLALLTSTLGTWLLLTLRVGVLSRWSLPYHALALAAVVLAILQFRRDGSRAARICGGLGAAFGLFLSTAIEMIAPYPENRPSGPEIGSSLAASTASSALDGSPVRFTAREEQRDKTLLVCFRGFW